MTPIIHSSAPVIHSVQFYSHDEALIARLRNIISSAIGAGNSVVVIGSQEHRLKLLASLHMPSGNVEELEKEKRLQLLDAEETLKCFMVKGLPDRELFFNTVGKIVDSAKQAAWNAQRGVTAFGEMVAVLWERGNYSGALQVETLWNELLSERAFHLHCAYPKWLFPESGGELAAAVCESHSHVIGQPAAA